MWDGQRMHGFMISLLTTGREECTALHVAYNDYVHDRLVQRTEAGSICNVLKCTTYYT